MKKGIYERISPPPKKRTTPSPTPEKLETPPSTPEKLKTPPNSPKEAPPKLNINPTTKRTKRKKRPRIPSDVTDISEKKRSTATRKKETRDDEFERYGMVYTKTVKNDYTTGSGTSLVLEREVQEYIDTKTDFTFIETPKDGNCLFSTFVSYFKLYNKSIDGLEEIRKEAETYFKEDEYIKIGDKEARIDGLAFRLLIKRRLEKDDTIQMKVLTLREKTADVSYLFDLIYSEFTNITKEKILQSKNCVAAWTSTEFVWIMMLLFEEIKAVYVLENYQENTGGNFWTKYYITQGKGRQKVMDEDVQVDSRGSVFVVFHKSHYSLLFPKKDLVKLKLLDGLTTIGRAKELFTTGALDLLKL